MRNSYMCLCLVMLSWLVGFVMFTQAVFAEEKDDIATVLDNEHSVIRGLSILSGLEETSIDTKTGKPLNLEEIYEKALHECSEKTKKEDSCQSRTDAKEREKCLEERKKVLDCETRTGPDKQACLLKSNCCSDDPPVLDQEAKPSFDNFQKYIKLLTETYNAQTHFKGSVSGGFTGDQAGDNTLYKVGVAGTLSRGTYPREVRFRASTDFQLKNGKQQENVTELLINYDYHPAKNIETFGFLERFTDDFLSIRERYEIGGGAKFERDVSYFKQGREQMDLFNLYPRGCLKCLFTNIRLEIRKATDQKPELSDQELALLAELIKALEDLQTATRKKAARLNLGIAASIFSELEQSQLNINGSLFPDGKDKTFQPDGTQKFRFTIRPSALLHLTEAIAVETKVYFKLPLESSRVNGKFDYRIDAVASLTINLNDAPIGDSTTLEFTYTTHFDNVPAIATGADLAEAFNLATVPADVVAQKRHSQFKTALKVTF